MTGTFPIGTAMADPRLYGPYFEGATWATWQACKKAAFGEPMSLIDLANFKRVADRDPPPGRVSTYVAVAGRGAGKDSTAALVATHLATTFDQQARLRPGERAVVQLVACDRDQAKIALSYIRGFFEEIPALGEMVTATDQWSISLNNRVDIQVTTNNYRTARGRSLVAVVLDEAAFYRSEDSASSDLELYAALKPGLARVPGSMLIVISSAYKRAGLLYQLWRDYYGKDDPDVLVVYGGTRDFNPSFPEDVITKALAEDPQSAAAEYLSHWRDDLSSFVPRELIEAAIDPGVQARPPIPGITYFAFCDGSSGAGQDSFTAAVAHAEADKIVLDLLYERRPPFSPTEVVTEVAALLKPYVHQVTGDRYSQGWLSSAVEGQGLRYVYSERDRSAVYLECLPLFTAGRARLLDNPRLVRQFSELERRTFSTGRDRVDHARGAHDDASNSAAGAMVLAAAKPAFDLATYIKAWST